MSIAFVTLCRELQVRRFDLETGALLMNWTRYPSKAAAGRALGLAGATIGGLVRGRKAHHAGIEARLYDSVDDSDGANDDTDEASAPAHPSPPYFAALVTKPVVLSDRAKSASDPHVKRSREDAPEWLRRTNAGPRHEHPSHPSMAVEVRRFDLQTGALRIPWTCYPSFAAAGRALGLAGATIGALVKGKKKHHAGVEARRCDSIDDDASEADDASPPFCSAMVTKSVVSDGMTSGGGGSGDRLSGGVPEWLGTNVRTTGGSQSLAVEVRRFDPQTGMLLMDWTRHPSKAAAGRAVGLAGSTIGDLAKRGKKHHSGVEARPCDSVVTVDDDAPEWFRSGDRSRAAVNSSQSQAVEVRFFVRFECELIWNRGIKYASCA